MAEEENRENEVWINPGNMVHLDDDRKALYMAVAGLTVPRFILDVGCGAGVLEFYMAKKNLLGDRTIMAIDIDGRAIEYARNARRQHHLDGLGMIAFEGGNAMNLQYADNTFDCVIMSEVLEHLQDWEVAYREAWRVLRTGGRLIVTVPDTLRVSDPEHMHVFTKESWEHIKDKVWLDTPRKWIGFYVEKKEVQ